MSYGLFLPCDGCLKAPRCSDPAVITGARDTIHSMPYNSEYGHLGGGNITVECFNKEIAQPEAPAEKSTFGASVPG